MRGLRRIGLGGRLLAIVLVVVVIDFLVNTVLFERASDFALREDSAQRMAEHIVVSYRVMERTPPAQRPTVARHLSTEKFTITWSPAPATEAKAIQLGALRRQVLGFEPELAGADLHMQLMPLSNGGNIGGSVMLSDRSLVHFRTFSRVAWSINFGRLLGLALPSALLLVLAWLLFRATLQPLKALVQATSQVGSADPKPLPVRGQTEVRQLIRAFNAMQERIHQLLASQSQTLLAVGHDLRTPLARLQLRIDNAGLDRSAQGEMSDDIVEMRDLLQSLQTYVESGDESAVPERIDIAAMAQTQVDNACDLGAAASYHGPPQLAAMARPVWIRRALANLIDNALLYAGNARVVVREVDDEVEIAVEDDGPGIPEDRMAEVLRPFIRLDNARARNTAGMGLGLPIVERAVQAEGGSLTLANIPGGGLRVSIRLPRAAT